MWRYERRLRACDARPLEQTSATDAPYLDPSQPLDVRLRDLLGRMTPTEKIDQMSMPAVASPALATLQMILFTPIIGTSNRRLGIPPLVCTGTSRGSSFRGTAFPVAIARGASWDRDLERRVHSAIGAEARALGANVLLSPCINLIRHPAFGRAQETYGEDPFHLSEFAVAAVEGAQKHVMAQIKHFALNSVEEDRFEIDMQVDARTLHEMYLPHFEAAVKKANAASAMTSYNRVNGQYAGENELLLRRILKQRWGFEGFVMSDWIHGTRSTVDAANNGLDIEMPAPVHYGRRLRDAVSRGEVEEKVIDEAAERVLRKKLCFGLFDRAPEIDLSVSKRERHRELALEAARKSIVLLKNSESLLPIDRDAVRSIAVLGRFAEKPRLGDSGSSNMSIRGAVAPAQGIRRLAGAARVKVYSGRRLAKARRTAAEADVAVVVAALTPKDEGEWSGPRIRLGGDRRHLGLHEADVALIRAVGRVSERVVVVIEAGSAVTMAEWIDEVQAVLMAWYPGREGGRAIAEILFGDTDPSAKTPLVFPRSQEQLYPSFSREPCARYDRLHGYRYFDEKELDPLFPVGFGLSYSKWRYTNLTLGEVPHSSNGELAVFFDLENYGDRAGEEVVQMYVGRDSSQVDRSPRELKAFEKLALEPGKTRNVELRLPLTSLAYFDSELDDWRVEAGRYRIEVGSSSRNLPLRAHFELEEVIAGRLRRSSP
jgi:beta-glucosidase